MSAPRHGFVLGLACLLLAASCSEDDAPIADSPTDKPAQDSSDLIIPDTVAVVDTTTVSDTVTAEDTTMVIDPVEETLLVNFYPLGWYADQSQSREGYQAKYRYVMVSDQSGNPLVVAPYEIGQQQSITVPRAYTDDKIQLTLLQAGTYTDDDTGQAINDLYILSFLDVDRGAEWNVPTYNYGTVDEAVVLGYASLMFENVDEQVEHIGIFNHDQEISVSSDQLEEEIKVPLYHSSSPLLVRFIIEGKAYAIKVAAAEVGADYTVDASKMEEYNSKELAVASGGYATADIRRAYSETGAYGENEGVYYAGYSSLNDEGKVVMHYPGDAFPAYKIRYDLVGSDVDYQATIKGAIPDMFPTPSFSATVNSTETDNFSINIQGEFDAFSARWIKEDNTDQTVWTVIGASNSNSFGLPAIPDSLSISTEGIRCEDVDIENYDQIDGYDSFLQVLHEAYDKVEQQSTRYERVSFSYEDTPVPADGRIQPGRKRNLFGIKR